MTGKIRRNVGDRVDESKPGVQQGAMVEVGKRREGKALERG